MAKLALSSAATMQILFLLRFIQQGALVLTGFVTSYFIYWHNALRDPVPFPLISLLTATILSYLENYISSALSLQRTSPNLPLLLKTSTPCTLLLSAGYYATRQMDFVRSWCEGDNWFRPVRETVGYKLAPAGVEEHHCALVCVLVGAGMAAVGISLVLSVGGAVGWLVEGRGVGRSRRGGYVVVGEAEVGDEYEYDGSTVCSVEDDK